MAFQRCATAFGVLAGNIGGKLGIVGIGYRENAGFQRFRLQLFALHNFDYVDFWLGGIVGLDGIAEIHETPLLVKGALRLI